MKALLVASLLTSLLCLGHHEGTQDGERIVQAEPFATIAGREATPAELAEAIAKLTLPARERPQFWSRMANDSRYPAFHRRSAVFQLLKRHARVGMKLSDLARLLDHPTWLHASDIGEVTILAGWIPILPFPGTVFWFAVPSDPGGDQYAVYVRVPAEVSLQDFRDLVLGSGNQATAGEASVAAIGFAESREHWWNTGGQH